MSLSWCCHEGSSVMLDSFSADETFDSTYKSSVVVYSNGQINWIPPGIFRASCSIDITWFPFDDQSCYLKVKCFHSTSIRPGIFVCNFRVQICIVFVLAPSDVSNIKKGLRFELKPSKWKSVTEMGLGERREWERRQCFCVVRVTNHGTWKIAHIWGVCAHLRTKIARFNNRFHSKQITACLERVVQNASGKEHADDSHTSQFLLRECGIW